MIQQIDYEKWLDRIDTTLNVQKATGAELISQTYTRRELIELRLIISSVYAEDIREQTDED